jgi:hypothetical protein
MREIEGRDTAMPCPYRRSICIESLEKWYETVEQIFLTTEVPSHLSGRDLQHSGDLMKYSTDPP